MCVYMRRQIIYRNSLKTHKREASAQIDSEEKCLFQDFECIAITMGICAYGSRFITNRSTSCILGCCFTNARNSVAFYGARFVNKEINENKQRGFTFTGPIKAVCGVVLRSLSVTFMTICCCISHRYAVKIRSISLIWWIVKIHRVVEIFQESRCLFVVKM